MNTKYFAGKRERLGTTGSYPHWNQAGVLAAFVAATLGLASQAMAHQSPGTCTTNGSGASITFVAPVGATELHHGDEICFQVGIFNTCAGCCDITLLDSELVLPDGSIVPITVDKSVLFGDDFLCPGDARCATASTCTLPGEVGYRYIIAHGDEHGVTGVSCPPSPAAGSGELSAFIQSTSGTVHLAFHVGATLCKAIAASIGHACCEPCTGTCTNVFFADECPSPSVFTPDSNCDEVTCTPLVCNDNSACTSDSCVQGTGCVFTPIPPCNDNSLCTTDSCDPATGCVFTPIPPCNDNNACTNDSCDPATGCVFTPIPPCNDNNACTNDSCDPATGCVFTPILPCNDNNACTNDSCDPATGCVFTPIPPCNDSNACTNDSCNPATGCVFTAIPPCNDNNACTNDSCDPATGCVFTPILPCNDNSLCTTDSCNPATGCVFTPNPPCNDNNACTNDSCDPATGCVFSPIPPCNDNNACTNDSCNPATGCVFTPIPPCNDNNACTTDSCNPATGCVFTPIPPCNDNITCTTDSCNPATGCVFTRVNAQCNDGFACTNPDVCDPSDPRANPVTGCVITPVDSKCVDLYLCTDDSCSPGVPGSNPVTGCLNVPVDSLCDDHDGCTADSCDPGPPNPAPDGCIHTVVIGLCCVSDADCPPDPADCFDSYCDPTDGLCKTALIAGGIAAFSDADAVGQDDAALMDYPDQVAGPDRIQGTDRVSISKKGSLLYYSKIELKWNATAPFSPRQDTFLTIVNDYPEPVCVQWYFINGDDPTAAVFAGSPPVRVERSHKGCNQVDCTTELSANKTTYMSALTGGPLGCQPFSILDTGTPPGRPDPENADQRLLRGYAIAFAVDCTSGAEISWNHLSGHVDIVNYADRSAWEYNTFAFQCVADPVEGNPCGGDPGTLHMDGIEFDYAYDKLLFDFYAVGSQAFSLLPNTFVMVDTDLTLYPVSVDLRTDNTDSDGPVVTRAKFDIWNQNEDAQSGVNQCISCWDQTLLCSYNAPNSFLITNLGTDKGKARIDGIESDSCDAPGACCDFNDDPDCDEVDFRRGTLDKGCSQNAALLGVSDTILYFSGSVTGRTDAGTNLVGQGSEEAIIQRDLVDPPDPLTVPRLIGRDGLPIDDGAAKDVQKPKTR